MLNIGSLIIDGLDYIMIVDKNYRIVYNTRYDSKINDNSQEYRSIDIDGKYYFDVYPQLKRENSSVVSCIETGEVIIVKSQSYSDSDGREYLTNNVTIPLRRKGELVAVVELAMDVEKGSNEVGGKSDGDKRFDDFVKKVKEAAGLITFDTILTDNDDMLRCIEKAKLLSKLLNPTLIYGETGTGKELFVQGMLNYSGVARDKIVIQNCAAVPENLMESILFGTVKGAYTGAETRKGLFEAADGGAIFLDELNSMPFSVQAKLLRVLQDGTFRPIGSNSDKQVTVKVIAAMNIDPEKAIEKNVLRKDLFYRFSSGLISLPPLRERREDIRLYIGYFLKYFSDMYNKRVAGISKELVVKFENFDWEGNVRELMNAIESMITFARPGKELTEAMLPGYLKSRFSILDISLKDSSSLLSLKNEDYGGTQAGEVCAGTTAIPYRASLEALERQMILEALKMVKGNKSKACEILGIPRQTLRYRMRILGIDELEK